MWLVLQLCVWLVATLLSAALTRAFRARAFAMGLVDRPHSEGHKNHVRATAVVGGLAMWGSWIALLVLGIIGAQLIRGLLPEGIRVGLSGLSSAKWSLLVIALCATALAVMGAIDDRRALGAGRKLAFQVIVAAVTATFGSRILVGVVPTWISWILTVLWLTTIINAMNFFDNMDGLAGGVSLIAFGFFFAIAAVRGQYFVGMLSALSGGVVLGFLFYNFPKASVFMGDCGSHFLGYLLGVSCIITTFYHHENTPSILAVSIPLLVLAVPLLDAVTVVLIRLHLHKPVYVGDNRHISHRFVALGLSRPKAVVAIWLLSLLAGTGALALIWTPPTIAFLILAQMLAMVTLILLIQLGAHPPEG